MYVCTIIGSLNVDLAAYVVEFHHVFTSAVVTAITVYVTAAVVAVYLLQFGGRRPATAAAGDPGRIAARVVFLSRSVVVFQLCHRGGVVGGNGAGCGGDRTRDGGGDGGRGGGVVPVCYSVRRHAVVRHL